MANTKKAKPKGKTTVKQETIAKIKRTVQRRSKVGFSWDDNFVQQLEGKTTAQLKKIKANLYDYATYDVAGSSFTQYIGETEVQSHTYEHRIITGREGLEHRKQVGIEKAEYVRQYREYEKQAEEARQKWIKEHPDKVIAKPVKPLKIENVVEQPVESDVPINVGTLPTAKDERTVQTKFDQYAKEGDKVYKRLMELIDSNGTAGATYLRNMLAWEVEKYGYDNVVASIGKQPSSTISKAERAAYYKTGSSTVALSIRSIANSIKGTVPTLDDLKQIEVIADATDDFNQ